MNPASHEHPNAVLPARILIAEDERIVAGDLQARLRRLGYQVAAVVATGEAAIAAAVRHQPDLVLMDIRLEGSMDGIQAADTIHRSDGTPVIYLSAYADTQTIERAKVTEPLGYLIKPFDDSELRTTIEMALYKRKMEDERRVLEGQLLQAQKMESIGTLVVGLAHNLNNILAIILGYSSRLERAPDDPAKLSQSVTAINQAVRRGATLIQQLIGVTTKANLLFSSVNVNAVIDDLVHMAAEIFPKTITFIRNLDSTNPFISAEQNQLHQAILNILLNARDAMPQGGSLTITTETVDGATLRGRFPHPHAGPYVRITITDTGEGMDEETKRHAFEPFFTTRDRATFTGLGLSVAYGIVSSHKGFIDLDSTVGTGTTVLLYFPVESRSPSSVLVADDVPAGLAGGRETILVVEDEEMLRTLVREVLTRSGYAVLEAADGEEGAEVFAAHKESIDLVLLDLGLPKLSGEEVFARIRARDPIARVVFSTGYVREQKTEELLRLGARGVVHKPYTIANMLKTIREVLDRPRA
jgi:two-component system, cell cycle sensor histidine kinase and response regulator CckA